MRQVWCEDELVAKHACLSVAMGFQKDAPNIVYRAIRLPELFVEH
jgi:hypothetical protein